MLNLKPLMLAPCDIAINRGGGRPVSTSLENGRCWTVQRAGDWLRKLANPKAVLDADVLSDVDWGFIKAASLSVTFDDHEFDYDAPELDPTFPF